VKVRIIQIPYTGYISASWYNREESYLEQLEVFSNCSFLIAQNMLLHLRIGEKQYIFFEICLKKFFPVKEINRKRRFLSRTFTCRVHKIRYNETVHVQRNKKGYLRVSI